KRDIFQRPAAFWPTCPWKPDGPWCTTPKNGSWKMIPKPPGCFGGRTARDGSIPNRKRSDQSLFFQRSQVADQVADLPLAQQSLHRRHTGWSVGALDHVLLANYRVGLPAQLE